MSETFSDLGIYSFYHFLTTNCIAAVMDSTTATTTTTTATTTTNAAAALSLYSLLTHALNAPRLNTL